MTALGLRQIARLMPPSPSTRCARAVSCRQSGNFLPLANVGVNKPERIKTLAAARQKGMKFNRYYETT
jgi:hypothetical protein